MKIFKKITGIIFWIFLIMIALYSTSIIVQKLAGKDATHGFLGYKNFIVLTGSMEPTLNIGDIVVIKETKDVREGDIISFRLNNSIVTHRVFEVYEENDKEYYVTKGDANTGTDTELTSMENIEGKYCFKIPFLGKVILFLQRPIGIVILFAIFTLFVLLSFIKPRKVEKTG